MRVSPNGKPLRRQLNRGRVRRDQPAGRVQSIGDGRATTGRYPFHVFLQHKALSDCRRDDAIGYDLPFAPVRRFSASRCRCSAVCHLRAPFPSTNAAVGLGNSKSLTQRATYPIIRSKGPLSKPTTAAQPRRREPLLMLRVFGRLPVTDSGAHSRAGVGKASGEETAGGVCAGSGVGLWGFSVDLGAGAPVWNRDDG